MAIRSERPKGTAFTTGLYVIDEEELEALNQELEERQHGRVNTQDLAREVRLSVWQAVAEDRFEPPRLPGLAAEILATAQDPTVSIRKIGHLVQRDQFLSGAVLKAANAAVYAPRHGNRRVTRLPEAVMRLGLKQTRNVVLAAAMRQTVFRGPRRKLMEKLWRAALGAGVACSLLGELKGKDRDQAFTMGLLHDVGKPVLAQHLDKVIKREYPGRVVFEDVAKDIFHLMHARLGANIIRRWRLPAVLADLVLHHHDARPPKKLAATAAMLRLADMVYQEWTVTGRRLPESERLMGHLLVRRLRLAPREFQDALLDYPAVMESWLGA